jgi:hypothetical protein
MARHVLLREGRAGVVNYGAGEGVFYLMGLWFSFLFTGFGCGCMGLTSEDRSMKNEAYNPTKIDNHAIEKLFGM